jgi:hypothetical protein
LPPPAGIVVTWNYNGSGPDAASWTAWAIVNMQTMQLIFFYMRLHRWVPLVPGRAGQGQQWAVLMPLSAMLPT